jgi:hypothetical protein
LKQHNEDGIHTQSLFVNEAQRRHAAASLRHAFDLVEEAEKVIASRGNSAGIKSDLSDEQTDAALQALAVARRNRRS